MPHFTTRRATEWVESLAVGMDNVDRWTFQPGPDLAEKPDRVVMVTLRPGAGLTYEGAFDSPMMQITVRGKQNLYDETEEFALELDKRITFDSFPADVDGVHIMVVQRIGGRPDTPMPDGDNGSRFTLSSNYHVSASTDI